MVAAEPPLPGRSRRRRPEDTADGCRALAEADRTRAAAMANDHMRGSLERSAATWTDRATLLDRLEDQATARVKAEARPRITGLSEVPERKDGDAD